MRTPLYNDDLEDFLQKQADDHRMYPSDKLWRNIQFTLHGESRWPALTYISIFIIAALVVSTLLVKPEERLKKNIAAYATENTSNAANKKTGINHIDAAVSSPVQHSYTEKITQHTIEAVNDKVYKEQQLAIINAVISPSLLKSDIVATTTKTVPATALAATIEVIKTPELALQAVTADNDKSNTATIAAANSKPASLYFNTFGLMNTGGLKLNSAMHTFNAGNEEVWRNYPLLNAADIIRKKLSRFNFQFYITPSVSYRRLTDAKGKAAQSYTAIPLSANYKIDINNIVKHTPSAGAEVGFALGYKLNDRLTVKTGLQFNVRQYNIEAYNRQVPPVVAPPAQDAESAGGSAINTDAFATSSNYAQNAGKPIVLRNRYYEAAAPIGLDWKVFTGNGDKLTVNLAVAIQPTYTFDKEPFVITTDYKTYADGSSIMRNWNLNSNIEAYISYPLGPLRWQIGPQFRYQHLPTYGGGYPIREHLLDYGMKIGFTKSLD